MGENGDALMDTALEAARGKASAAASGLFWDPYATLLDESPSCSSRLPPLFLRGNFARVAVVEKFITSFLGGGDQNPWPCQVISLGAGRDSAFFRILSSREYWPKDVPSSTGWFEVDLPAVAEAKVSIIEKSERIEKLIGAMEVPSSNCWSWPSVHYHVIGADLRRPISLLKALSCTGAVCGDVPTFILAECVLCYLEKRVINDLLCSLKEAFPCSAILSYEPMFPLNDNFAHVMTDNLRCMGCPMAGAVEGLQELKCRFKCTGWTYSLAMDMLEAYQELLDDKLRETSETKVVLDELEEWHLVMSHYAVCLAVVGDTKSRFSNELLLSEN